MMVLSVTPTIVRKLELNTTHLLLLSLQKAASIFLFSTLAGVMLLSVSPRADGKILPTGQPDIRLDIQAGTMLTTEDKSESFYSDVAKVHQIFDEAMVPALERFLGERWSELEGEDVRWVRMTYYNQGGMEVSVGPVYGTVEIEEKSDAVLQTIDSINVRLSPAWFSAGGGMKISHWLYSGLQVPNASARIAYLTSYAQDMITRHNTGLTSISAVMFEDMARISVGQVTEYANEIRLIVPLLPSSSYVYMPPDSMINNFILFAKSANKPLTISAELSTYGNVSTTMTYPNGTQVLIDPVRFESDKSESETNPYNSYQYRHYLQAKEPSGIYKLFFEATAASSPLHTNLHIGVVEGYFPPYDEGWGGDTIFVDNTRYDVRYRASENMQVGKISLDIPRKSLLIPIKNAHPESELTIQLPRDLIDSILDDESDTSFLVTLSEDEATGEGESIEYKENFASDQVRVLTIGLNENTSMVEIRGTKVVPEFSFVILTAAAVIGAVLATTRLVTVN